MVTENTFFQDSNRYLKNARVGVEMKEKRNDRIIWIRISKHQNKRKGDMAKSVDATDLIELSLGMETY